MPKTNVVVLMGGNGDEKEVSLKSGYHVIENLDPNKYRFVPAIISEVDSWLDFFTNPSPNTVVFIALHGKYGEDGRVQGLLDLLDIPYTGCGVLASAIGMDKIMFKKIMKAENITTPESITNPKDNTLKFPCVIKPSSGGSSIGVTIVHNPIELKKAVKEAQKHDTNILIEEFIEGIEISCGVLGNDKPVALPVIEIRPKRSFFDYRAKYEEGMSEEICPAEISKAMTEKVQDLAVRVFRAIGARGFSRIDMIIKDDKPYVLEINTIPGLTPQSLLPKEAAAAGIPYPKLLDRLISLAIEKRNI
jgi:D-alanine-D-alanine ligase